MDKFRPANGVWTFIITLMPRLPVLPPHAACENEVLAQLVRSVVFRALREGDGTCPLAARTTVDVGSLPLPVSTPRSLEADSLPCLPKLDERVVCGLESESDDLHRA